MLKLYLPPVELYNEDTSEFVQSKPATLQLEHSLVSLSKWESTWCKPFLTQNKKSMKELLDYIRCMTITQNVDPAIIMAMPQKYIDIVMNYIDAPMTATRINRSIGAVSREIITSERIYYWMIAFGIPFECQKWHLNRLMTLIDICAIENSPKKKMSRREIYDQNRMLNSQRRKAHHSKG